MKKDNIPGVNKFDFPIGLLLLQLVAWVEMTLEIML